MGRFIVFCAAEFDGKTESLAADDYILAADGGLRHVESLGLIPDGILGDFDSLGYIPEGSQVFPVEKDDTDSMLAARKGLSLGYREFLFYGALDGERLDHTVANYQTLQFLADRGADAFLLGKNYVVTVVKDGTLTFPARAEGILSLFCLGADAEGVTLKNLQYPLESGTLTPGCPLGVSNHFTGKPASVTVRQGSLLSMWDRRNGICCRRERTYHEAQG